jgi:hypothetical protein
MIDKQPAKRFCHLHRRSHFGLYEKARKRSNFESQKSKSHSFPGRQWNVGMPPKRGVGVGAGGGRSASRDSSIRTPQSANYKNKGPQGNGPLATAKDQPKFFVAPLVVEGVALNKLQVNDLLKQKLVGVRISDIQLSRTGIFTIYAADVISFNRVLNELPAVLNANGQGTAKVFVPRSIQRIQDTEKVAFVKRIDIEISDDRVIEALKDVGLKVESVMRLTGKDGNTPTRTMKVTLSDTHNRNTFVQTGLQVDSMHFVAERATQNTKPVQCYLCLKYNHVAKYCKTKQQICNRCGDNHHIDLCTAAKEVVKCCNCKGNHLATSTDCQTYKAQQQRMLTSVTRYAAPTKPATIAPATINLNDYPLLPSSQLRQQQQQQYLQTDMIDEIVKVITAKMEKIIEETINRLFKTLQQKVQGMEKTIAAYEAIIGEDESDFEFDSSEEENPVPKVTDMIKQKQATEAIKFAKTTANKPPPTKPAKAAKEVVAPPLTRGKAAGKNSKRTRSPNSSMESSTAVNNSKDLKTTTNNVD